MAREGIRERRGAGSFLTSSLSRLLSIRCFRAAPQLTEHLEKASLYNAGVLHVFDKSLHGLLFLCYELFFLERSRYANADRENGCQTGAKDVFSQYSSFFQICCELRSQQTQDKQSVFEQTSLGLTSHPMQGLKGRGGGGG